MLHDVVTWLVDTVHSWGYMGIFLLMFLESSFFPFPSEVVMIPAGYLAYQSKMNLWIVILFGILGSMAGALFNYYLSKLLGRAFLLRYGKYVFFKPEHLTKMELFFAKHGHISTFTGRLIPGVRQYISMPAGLAHMNLAVFSFYTSLGAGIWVAILALMGYFIGGNETLIKENLRIVTVGVVAMVAVLLAVYYFWQKRQALTRQTG